VLQGLIQDKQPAGYWLAGAILADGPGEDIFESWRDGLSQRFHAEEMSEALASAWAWASSRQGERRRAISESWSRHSNGWTWLQAALAESWRENARLGTFIDGGKAFTELVRQAGHEQGVARARVLLGSHPTWPKSPLEFVLLRLFPTPRIMAAARLQLILSLRVPPEEFDLAARHLLTLSPERSQSRAGARELARYFAQDWMLQLLVNLRQESAQSFARNLARDLVRYLARDWARDWARDLARGFMQGLTRGWVRRLAQDLAQDWTRNWSQDWARGFTQDWTMDWTRGSVHDWARDWNFGRTPTWLFDFATVEVHSAGRAGTRALIVYSLDDSAPHSRLLKAACWVSLHPDTNPTALTEALASYPSDGDPLWPALARHLTRRSTDEDRALLIDLAQHPEKREPPLSWGLRYYLRGDLVLEDGSEVTLDELCARLGLPPLPYLEDMPTEIEVD